MLRSLGGKRAGKRGRGTQGTSALLVACEQQGAHAGFVAIEAVEAVTHTSVHAFATRHLQANPEVSLSPLQRRRALGCPGCISSSANLKRALLGTFHCVSPRYLQDYLNEFCCRFNRRFWEHELPSRLLRLCVEHAPASFA